MSLRCLGVFRSCGVEHSCIVVWLRTVLTAHIIRVCSFSSGWLLKLGDEGNTVLAEYGSIISKIDCLQVISDWERRGGGVLGYFFSTLTFRVLSVN